MPCNKNYDQHEYGSTNAYIRLLVITLARKKSHVGKHFQEALTIVTFFLFVLLREGFSNVNGCGRQSDHLQDSPFVAFARLAVAEFYSSAFPIRKTLD